MQSAKRRIKRRKRRLCYVFLAVLAAVCIITSFVRAQNVEYTTREVVVEEGDTLWGIWEEQGHGRFEKWKAEVERLNEQDLSVLQPYDRIAIPVIIEI